MENRTVLISKRIENVILFCGLIVFLCIIGILRGDVEYFWDAKQYYDLSKCFIGENGFELLRFPICNRGVVFPAMLGIVLSITNAVQLSDALGIIIFNACGITLLFWFLVEEFLGVNNKMMVKIIGIVVFSIYWSDYIIYPLTDVWALLFIMLACICLKKGVEKNLLQYYVGVGGFCLCAYNTRAIYIVAIVVVMVSVLILNKKFKVLSIITKFSFMFLGLIIMGLPQILVNWNNYGIISPFIITSNQYDGGLFLSQLLWGMSYQRYDTFIGDISIYPQAAMNYWDSTGSMILNNMGIAGTPSLIEYCLIWINYPFEMIGVWGRHIINALSMPFKQVYIDSVQWIGINLLLNYIMFIIVILSIKAKCSRGISGYYWICIVPALAISFGAVETRFFLPIYIMVYVLLGTIDFRDLWRYIKSNWTSVVIFVSIYLIVGYSVVGNAFKHLDYPMLISW